MKGHLNVSKYFKFTSLAESEDSDEDIDSVQKSRSIPPKARSLTPKPSVVRASKIIGNVKSLITTSTPRDSPALANADSDDDAELLQFLEKAEEPLKLSRPMTPAMRRVIATDSPVPDRSGTPFQSNMAGRIQCKSLTAKGLRCRNAAVVGFEKCRVHNY